MHFNLTTHVSKKVDSQTGNNETLLTSISRFECFYACFNTAGCYTFSYDSGGSKCHLYTGCGTTCVLIDDSNIITYVRECGVPTITGIFSACFFVTLYITF